MQLAQPWKCFSVTIFRTHSIGSIGVRTWVMLLFLVTLKNFDVCTVTLRCLLIESTKFSILGEACIWLVLILAILQVGEMQVGEIHVYSR